MGKKAQYLRWLSIGCAALALFCVAIMTVGYQPWSIGRIVTTVLLIVGAVVFAVISRRLSSLVLRSNRR